MATVFDLPPLDVLFTHIFGYLGALEIWRLRLVCRDLHSLCWEYFTNVCTSLSVDLYPVESSIVTSDLGLGAGITILRKCKKVRSLEIASSEVELAGKSLGGNGFYEVLSALIDADIGLLRRLCFSCTDFSTVIPLIDNLSLKCCQLEELELCDVVTDVVSVQWILSQLLQYSKYSLQKLSIEELTLPPSHQLPIKSLSGLRYFSVKNCSHVSSEGFLEELFRKCPLLEVVDLRNVKTVSNRTLLVLAEYCRALKQIFVKGCPLAMEPLTKLHKHGVNIDIVSTDRDVLIISRGMKFPGQI